MFSSRLHVSLLGSPFSAFLIVPPAPPKSSIQSIVFVFGHYYVISVSWCPVSTYLALFSFCSFFWSHQGAKINWASYSALRWFFHLITTTGLNKEAELILLYTMYATLLHRTRMSLLFPFSFFSCLFVLRNAQMYITRTLSSDELSQCLGLHEMCPKSCKS